MSTATMGTAADPVSDILSRLDGAKATAADQWQARCPAHDDAHASLCIGRGSDGRALIKCQAGCTSLEVCRALGIKLMDLFPPKAKPARGKGTGGRIVATYDYRDAAGKLLYQVVRFEPKDFRQRRPDGNGGWTWKVKGLPLVLYRLPELLEADPQEWVFVVEGEKDVDNLRAAGLTATCNTGGAGKWGRLSDDAALDGRKVAIVADRDAPGASHAADVARRRYQKSADVRILNLPAGIAPEAFPDRPVAVKDASDYLAAGGTAQQLIEMADQAPAFDPESAPQTHMDDDTAYVLTPGPHIDPDGAYTEQSAASFADAVLGGLPADAIYRKDFITGEILGGAGRRRWVEAAENRMRIVIDSHVRLGKWVKSRASGEQVIIYQACGKDCAGLVIAQARQHPRIRELTMMVNYPIYAPGFSRVMPGWHEGLYYDEPEDLGDLEPETDCEVIHNVLHDLVIDFPFKTEADRQNFFGLLLTPLVAPAVSGNRPLHMILAPLERTGKTKLAEEVFGGVILGRQTPAMQITDRDEERDKRVIGMLLHGETLMHLDNLPPFIDSASIASLLTATTYGGRLLGGNRMVNLPNNLTLVASGNNVQASGEIIKRAVPICLQPNTPTPEARRDFHHPDLRTYVADQRKTVLSCLLGLIENWIAAGKPLHASVMGGFESWSAVVGGILQVNGMRQWRTNESVWRRDADPKGTEMKDFVDAWYATYGLAAMSPKDLLRLAEEHEMFEEMLAAKKTPQAQGAAFGKLLRRHSDAPVGQWYIKRGQVGNHSIYRLEAIQ